MKSSRGYILLSALFFILSLTSLYYYNSIDKTLSFKSFELKKIDYIADDFGPNPSIVAPQKNISETPNSLNETEVKIIDSVIEKSYNSNSQTFNSKDSLQTQKFSGDTAKQRILLMGDSEAGGIMYPLNDYCQSNGHQLVASIVWNSATSLNFSRSDTIDYFINKYKPTFIFVVFGLNEVLSKDFNRRKTFALKFKEKISKYPYVWVGPTNWGSDFVVSDAYSAAADPNAFFLSKNLALPKGPDGKHPNSRGYRDWMSKIADWITYDNRWKIKMLPPDKYGYPKSFKTIVLNATNYRGY